jgi:ParB-like chromosome segregation protein Spo0J
MTSATAWRNRIIGHGEEAPDQLLANPRNWRIHPKAQQDALAGVLDQVGWVQDVIVNQQTGHVVDGHARVAIAISRQEPSVPVVYVDLSEDEEALILATLDPLSAMAATDREQLSELLAEISTGDAAVQAMLDQLAASITPTLPTPSEQAEPMLKSECLIEIRCTNADRDDFGPMLSEWGARDGVTINVS